MSTTMDRKLTMLFATLLATGLFAAPAAAGVDDRFDRAQLERQAVTQEADGLARVQAAADRYVDIVQATADGFAALPYDAGSVASCAADTDGAGVRLVRGLDGWLDPGEPEALVYALDAEGAASLVALDYIVPTMFVEDEAGNVVAVPEVLGRPLHKHATLPIYTLRAWIGAASPRDMFTEIDRVAADCLPV